MWSWYYSQRRMILQFHSTIPNVICDEIAICGIEKQNPTVTMEIHFQSIASAPSQPLPCEPVDKTTCKVSTSSHSLRGLHCQVQPNCTPGYTGKYGNRSCPPHTNSLVQLHDEKWNKSIFLEEKSKSVGIERGRHQQGESD